MKKNNLHFSKKQILLIGIAVLVAVVFLLSANNFANGGKTEQQETQRVNTIAPSNENPGELSGSIADMDPNRMMAGAPCHVMGGQKAGDCQTREIVFEAWKYSWSEPTITVKAGETVRLKVSSRDVTHGIAIPEIGFNMAIKPGETTIGEFIAPKTPGTYPYGCSVMCGSGHHNHRGQLVVVA